MSLSKIESRQLVGKTSHSVTLSEIPPGPHWHHLGQLPLTPTPVSLLTPSPLLFGSSTHPVIQKKILVTLSMTHFHGESCFELLVLLLCGHPSRPADLQQNKCLRTKGFLFFPKSYLFHQVWLMKTPLIRSFLLCFSVQLPFQGFKVRLVAVAAFPVAS